MARDVGIAVGGSGGVVDVGTAGIRASDSAVGVPEVGTSSSAGVEPVTRVDAGDCELPVEAIVGAADRDGVGAA